MATATETQRGSQSLNRLLRIGIKPLTKLRPKPQVSAAFRCSSIGIDAYGIDPKISVLLRIAEGFESGEQIRLDILGVDFAILANVYVCCWLRRSPAPGQSFVRLFHVVFFAKLFDDQFAFDERVLEAAPP